MTSRRMAMSAFGIALFTMSAAAQMTVEYAKPVNVRHPDGVVVDPAGAAIAGVRVESCQPHWEDCITAATTDAQGEFAFPVSPGQKRYYLKFSVDLFDPLLIEVRLRCFAKNKIVAQMKVAT